MTCVSRGPRVSRQSIPNLLRWSRSGLRSDGVKREATEVHGTSNEDVADEHETERGASRVPSLSEIVEVKARYCSQFLIGVDGERSELLRWRCRRYVFAGAAVQPMRPAVVDDRRMVGDALGRDAHDSAFEQLRERDTEASSSFD